MYKPFGSWMPDQPKYPMLGASVCKNVIPHTKTSIQSGESLISFSPFRDAVVYSNAITARCQGAFAALESDNNAHVFVGDATKLYKMSSGTTFADVTNSGGAYTTDPTGTWNATQFGDRVIFTNYIDEVQSFQMGSSSLFADLGATVPKAKHLAVVKEWLILGNIDNGTGLKPNRIHWSAIDDPTNFPTLGSITAAQLQSDAQDLPSELGHVQGIIGGLGTSDAAVFLEKGIYRMNYIGPPFIFSLQPAQGARGTNAPNSIVQQGSLVYYLGEDGFYVFDGTQSKPIGTEKVDKTFFRDMDHNHLDSVVGLSDPINKVIYWSYASINAVGGIADKIMVYNWSIDEWSLIEHVTQYIFRSLGLGVSLDSLDGVSTDLDALPYSLDSRVWQGGSHLLGGFDVDNKLIYFTGDNKAPTVETNEFQLSKDKRSVITNTRPIIDGGTPSISLSTRNDPTETAIFGAESVMNFNGDCPQLSNGRYHVARLTLPAASEFTHLEGIQVKGGPEGEL